MTTRGIIDEIAHNCLLSASRRLSRIVTSLYEEELRPHHIKASQFSLLVVVAKAGPVRRSDVGRYADIDPSTLTRNLAVMVANGWIEEVIAGDDGRGNPLQITAKGRRLIVAIAPGWRRAQQRVRKLLGSDRANILTSLFSVSNV
ncbi:MarR family winged helix-turn-helix transcriptional regulator [Mesorhizobium cantuariense]|uniref:MarR family winged helix-turn-helix transcriptional regulator n=1 Tax=Mesorhizobium cantuariense TaxID=1300275 RepID=A0ABV7MHN4_9HYPH